MKRFGQFGCAEHVCDALDVVCHRREADFDPCAGQSAHQQTRMPKDTVLDRCEGMFDSASAQPHHFRGHSFLHLVQRVFIQVTSQATSRSLCAQPGFSEQVPQSKDEALYMM
jgi:hypothetical protein